MSRMNTISHLIANGLLALFAGPAWGEVCKGSKLPKPRLGDFESRGVVASSEPDIGTAHVPDRGGVVRGSGEGVGS